MKSDCIILPSYYREGLPRILQEANYFGRICITSRNVGCKDVIIDGFNGFLCKKKSVSDLTRSIRKVIKINKSRLTIMEKNAHFFVKKNFDKEKINFQFLNIISNVVKV